MKEVMEEAKKEICNTIDTNCQNLDSKINKNTEEVIKIQVAQEVLDEKVTSIENTSNKNAEMINDFELRLKKMEATRRVDQNKILEIEKELDGDQNTSNNPDIIKELSKEILVLKEVNVTTNKKLSKLQTMQEDCVKEKLPKETYSSVTRKDSVSSPINPKQFFVDSKMEDDTFKEARGKVGIFPMDVESIRKHSEHKDDPDSEYLTEFRHIYMLMTRR